MFIFLTGKNDYAKHRRAGVLRSGFLAKYDKHAHQVETFSGAHDPISEMRRAIQSMGLFQEKRFITIWEPSKLKKEDRAELLDYIYGKDDDTVVVMVDDGLHPSTGKSIGKKAGKSELFNEPSPKDMRMLANELAEGAGVSMEDDAAGELAALCGTDGWHMESTILRLASVAKGKGQPSITKGLVQANTLGVTEDNIFALTDALSAKNYQHVLAQLEDQRKTGAHELQILAMLTKHVRTLMVVKETGGEGIKAHPFVIKKAREAIGRFTDEELQGLYSRLLEAEKTLKLSPPDPWSVLFQALSPKTA